MQLELVLLRRRSHTLESAFRIAGQFQPHDFREGQPWYLPGLVETPLLPLRLHAFRKYGRPLGIVADCLGCSLFFQPCPC